jgi:hypothetical protein
MEKGKSTVETVSVCEPQPQTEEAVEAEIATPELNFAKPMAATENDAAKEIIITEEGSGGVVTVKVYHLRFEDGKWILQPELIMNAAKQMIDSAKRQVDSLQGKLKKAYPSQQ